MPLTSQKPNLPVKSRVYLSLLYTRYYRVLQKTGVLVAGDSSAWLGMDGLYFTEEHIFIWYIILTTVITIAYCPKFLNEIGSGVVQTTTILEPNKVKNEI